MNNSNKRVKECKARSDLPCLSVGFVIDNKRERDWKPVTCAPYRNTSDVSRCVLRCGCFCAEELRALTWQKIEEDLAHEDATPAPTVRFTGGFCCAVSVGTHDYNYRASPSVSDHVLR